MVSGLLIFRLFILIISFTVLSGSSSDASLTGSKLLEEPNSKKYSLNKKNKAKPKGLSFDESILKDAKDYVVANAKDCGKKALDKVCELTKKAPGLSPKVLSYALHAYQVAKDKNEVSSEKLTIIDYSKPSNENRLWVLDLEEEEVTLTTKVAHGAGSGSSKIAKKFSNVTNSHASSIGVAKTKDIYFGKHGKSLRLEGLEAGYNDRLFNRAVVIHGANYVNKNGNVGRSWGCPAVSNDVVGPLVDDIKNGSLVFLYYPDKNWINNSEYL